MNIKVAALNTSKLADGMSTINARDKLQYDHIKYMLRQITANKVIGEKAHRWLGWAQAAVYANNINVSLEDLKEINKEA